MKSINIFFDNKKLYILGNKRYKSKDVRKYPRNKDCCWGRNKRTSILGPLFRRQSGTRRLLSTPCFRRNFLAAQIRASFPLRDIARQTALTLLARCSRIKLHRFVTGQKTQARSAPVNGLPGFLLGFPRRLKSGFLRALYVFLFRVSPTSRRGFRAFSYTKCPRKSI